MYEGETQLGFYPFDPGDPFGPKLSDEERRVLTFHLEALQRNAFAYVWYRERIPTVHVRLMAAMSEWFAAQETVDALVRPAYERALRAGVIRSAGLGFPWVLLLLAIVGPILAYIGMKNLPPIMEAHARCSNSRLATEAEIERAKAAGELPQFPPGVLPEPDVPGTGVDKAIEKAGTGLAWLLGLAGAGLLVMFSLKGRK